MATEKTVNYTDAQVERLKLAYAAVAEKDYDTRFETVKALAAEMGKNTKSIVAKLNSLKVYIPKQYVTKKGEAPVKKSEWADAIGKILQLSEPEVDSLEKVNKGVLEKIVKALANSKPIEPGDGNGE